MCVEQAQVWKNLGECYLRLRNFESAHFSYTSALEIQRMHDAMPIPWVRVLRLTSVVVTAAATTTTIVDTLAEDLKHNSARTI